MFILTTVFTATGSAELAWNAFLVTEGLKMGVRSSINDVTTLWGMLPSTDDAPSVSEIKLKEIRVLLEEYKKENQQLKDTLAKGNLNTQECVDQVSNVQKQLKEEHKTLQEANETLEKIRSLEQQIEQLTHTIETKDQTIKSISQQSRFLLEKAEQKVKRLESRIQELEEKDNN